MNKIKKIKELEEKIAEQSSEYVDLAIWTVVFASLFVLTLVGGMIAESDNLDIDDGLAPYLCEQHNQTLSAVEHCMKDKCDEKYLRIYCEKTREADSIEDGYLLSLR